MKLLVLFAVLLKVLRCTLGNGEEMEGVCGESIAEALSRQVLMMGELKNCILVKEHGVTNESAKVLLSHVARHVPAMLLTINENIDWGKFFERKNFLNEHGKVRNCTRVQENLLNFASGDKVLIYIYSPTRDEMIAERLYETYNRITLVTSIPKVLLVSITNEKISNYTKMFEHLVRKRIIDVDILEVASNQERQKNLLEMNPQNCTVHLYNPFTEVYGQSIFSSSTKWFQQKLGNLNGFKVNVTTEDERRYLKERSSIDKKDTVQLCRQGTGSIIARYYKDAMNLTWQIQTMHKEPFDIRLELIWKYRPYENLSYLKPASFDIYRIYTPLIYDEFYGSSSLVEIGPCFTAVSIIIAALQLCKKLGNFNESAWSPLSLWRILLGLTSKAYILKSLLEHVLLYLMLSVGIFCASELSNIITDDLVPIKVERIFNSFQDLKESNITLWLHHSPKKPLIEYIFENSEDFQNAIEISGIEFEAFDPEELDVEDKAIQNMSRNGNIAISILSSPYTLEIFDSTISREGKIIGRKSQMIENSGLWTNRLQPSSPYLDKFSHLYWRFIECGFDHLHLMKYNFLAQRKQIINSYLSPIGDNDDDCELDNSISTCYIVAFILVSALISLLILVVELLIF